MRLPDADLAKAMSIGGSPGESGAHCELAARLPASAARPHSRWPWQALLRQERGAKPGAGRYLAVASIAVLGVHVAGAGLAYLTQLVTVRVIGADNFGTFAYVLAWTTLLAYFSTLGFHVSLLRFLSAYRATGAWSLARGISRYAHRTVAFGGLCVAATGTAIVVWLGDRLPGGQSTAFLIGLAAVPVIALHQVGAAAVRAYGGVVSAAVTERLVRDSVLLAVVAAGWWSAVEPADGSLAMTGALGGALAALALVRVFLRRVRPAHITGATATTAQAEWWRPTLPLTMIMIADNVICRCGIIVLGLSGDTRGAGVFAVAYGLALITTLPRIAVASIFAPAVSALHAGGDQRGLQRLVTRSAVLSLAGTVCLAGALLVALEPLLSWFGPKFAAGVPAVWILVAGHVFSAAFGPQQHLLTMTGNEKASAGIFTAAALINLTLCVVLVEPLGVTGVAVAMSAGLVVWNVALALHARRRLGLVPGLADLIARRRMDTRSSNMANVARTMLNDPAPIAGTDKSGVRAAADPPAADPAKSLVRMLLRALETSGVRYCHWKSNIRVGAALSGVEDLDLLVAREDTGTFQSTLLDHGFKLARSRGGIDHPGVFHALGLDEATGELVHVHAYTQIVTGDSLVKSYRLQIEDALLENTRWVEGVRVPSAEVELVIFAIRFALKHVNAVEIVMASRNYQVVLDELAWLRAAADEVRAGELCTRLFPEIEPKLFASILRAIGPDGSVGQRMLVGQRVAMALRRRRRMGRAAATLSRMRHVLVLLAGRFRKRKDLMLQSGGAVVAFVGPKATGKSTLTRALGERLGEHLDIESIHAGKPPATALSALPRAFIPLARRVLSGERPGEYEKAERRQEKSYSLLYVLRMTLAAYDRRSLLIRAMRKAAAGTIVISDRYPSEITGAIDSSCFDDEAITGCGAPLKRWLMQRERALYRTIPRPDLVVRLAAPIGATLERDAMRSKEGGPDSETLQRRWALETQAFLDGHRVVRIDTDKPIDDTIRAVVGSVWRAL